MNSTKDIIEEIFFRLDKTQLLAELEPKKIKNNYYSLICPSCKEKTAYIYEGGTTILCNRKNNCFYNKSLWDYTQETFKHNSNKETLEYLAKITGVNLKNSNFNNEVFEKSKQKTNLLNIALEYFINNLWNDPEKKVINYLKNRGYTEDDIKTMELGFYYSYKKTLEYLKDKGFSEEKITEVLKWLKQDSKHREEYNLVIPIKNSIGNLSTLYGRIIEKSENKDKYKPLSDAENLKENLFNIYKARYEKRIIIVEGYLDALVAEAKGVKGITATGGSSLTSKQLESLENYKIKNIVLAFDNDKAGKEGTLKAINSLANSNIKVFVANNFEDCKDPDEFIKKNGINNFHNLINNAISASKYYANYLLENYNLEEDQQKSEFLELALEYDSKLPITKAHEGQEFLTIISEKTNYDIETLIAESEVIQEKRKREFEIKEYKKLLLDGNKLLEQNQLDTLKELLTEKPKEFSNKIIKPFDMFYTSESFLEDLRNTNTGLKTGYKKLDEFLTIPNGALTIVMGKSSHGKTTFLLNLLLKMVEMYEKKAFFFFSYEEEAKFLNVKLINILANTVINKHNNFTSILDYLRWSYKFSNKNKEIEETLNKINTYAENKRLGLIYQNLDVDELYEQIKVLKQQSDFEIGGIFIDYIQRIPIKGKFQQRQLELQAISNRILEASIDFNLPIILGAQVNKEVRGIPRDKDVRESGDILNNANIVLSIYNPAKEENDVKPNEKDVVPFKVCLAKSRNSVSNNTEVELKLHGPTLRIFEE